MCVYDYRLFPVYTSLGFQPNLPLEDYMKYYIRNLTPFCAS